MDLEAELEGSELGNQCLLRAMGLNWGSDPGVWDLPRGQNWGSGILQFPLSPLRAGRGQGLSSCSGISVAPPDSSVHLCPPNNGLRSGGGGGCQRL